MHRLISQLHDCLALLDRRTYEFTDSNELTINAGRLSGYVIVAPDFDKSPDHFAKEGTPP